MLLQRLLVVLLDLVVLELLLVVVLVLLGVRLIFVAIAIDALVVHELGGWCVRLL